MKRLVLLSIVIILFLPLLVGCIWPLKISILSSPTPMVTITSLPPGQPPTPAPTRTYPPTLPADSGPIWVTNPVDRTLLRIDPASNAITASISIDGRPDAAIAGEGAVWVLDRAHNLVFRVDPASARVTASIPLPAGDANAMAVGGGAVWVGMTGKIDLNNQAPGQEGDVNPPGLVVQIDSKTNQFVGRFPVQPVDQVLLNGSALWVLSRTVIDTPLQVIDLGSKQGMAVPLRNSPEWLPADAVAVDPANLWLFSTAYGKIFRGSLDGRINSVIDVGQRQPTGYADLLETRTGLWAATPWGTVLQIDPATNHVDATIELNVPLTKLISRGWDVWVLSQQTGSLFRIDPVSRAVTAQIATGSRLQPTVIPSPTPRVVIWKPCPNTPTSRLKVGDLAYVTKDPPLPNRVRKEPNRQAEVLGLINPGGSMEILEGPTCADGWVWWKVKNADLTGWMAEGDPETYWMVTLFK